MEGERLLIVDDHAGFRGVARRVFENGGYNVVGECPSGEAALAAARELQPDVVLLDVQLPDLDGFEVAERLEQFAVPPAVVLISTRTASDYRARLRGSAARGFIQKASLSPQALRDLLDG